MNKIYFSFIPVATVAIITIRTTVSGFIQFVKNAF